MALHFQHDDAAPEPPPRPPSQLASQSAPRPVEPPAADLGSLQQRFAAMSRRRRELVEALPKLERRVLRAEEKLWNLERLPFVWRLLPGRIAALEQKVMTARRHFEQAQAELGGAAVALELACGPDVLDAFGTLRAAHEALKHCAGVWDITAAGDEGGSGGRAMNARSLPRRGAGFDERSPDLPPPDRRALRFGQEDGGVVRLYPGFVVACARGAAPALLHPAELTVSYRPCRYVEEGRIPADAELEDPSARPPRAELTIVRGFSAKSRIVALYGELWLHGPGGLAIGYLISDRNKASAFAAAYEQYRAALGAPADAPAPAEPRPLPAAARAAPAMEAEPPTRAAPRVVPAPVSNERTAPVPEVLPPEPPPARAAPRVVPAPQVDVPPPISNERTAPVPEVLPPEPPPARAAPRVVPAPQVDVPPPVSNERAPPVPEPEVLPPEPPPLRAAPRVVPIPHVDLSPPAPPAAQPASARRMAPMPQPELPAEPPAPQPLHADGIAPAPRAEPLPEPAADLPPPPRRAAAPEVAPMPRRWLQAGRLPRIPSGMAWRVGVAASVGLATVAVTAALIDQPLQQTAAVMPRPTAPPPAPPAPGRTPTSAPPAATAPIAPAPLRPTVDGTAPAERTAAIVRPAVPAARAAVVVRARVANLRAAPSRSARVLNTERRGRAFKVFARDGNWVQVGDSRPIGWIAAHLLRPAAP